MAFAYPTSFNQTLWRVINGDLYVSHLGSNLSGNGSPTKPYKTIQHAIDVATAGATIVIGTGHYNEAVDGLDKNCKLLADATVFIGGNSLDTSFVNMGENSSIRDFTISGVAFAVDGAVGELSSCVISSSLQNFEGTIKRCVLQNASINGTSIQFANCTLINSTSSSPTAIVRLESCHFGAGSIVQTNASALVYFDYCNQEPGSSIHINGTPYSSAALVQASFPGFQLHGVSVSPAFNNTGIGDFTLSSESTLKNSGRNRAAIGALGEAFKMDVAQIFAGEKTSGVIQNPEGKIDLSQGAYVGSIVTPVIDLGSVRPMRKIRLQADQVFDEAAFKLVSADESNRLPGAITVEMRYAEQNEHIGVSTYLPMIWDRIPAHDINYAGNGDINFVVVNGSFITTRYLQFRITLRNANDLALVLGQENNDLLLTEDERQILI